MAVVARAARVARAGTPAWLAASAVGGRAGPAPVRAAAADAGAEAAGPTAEELEAMLPKLHVRTGRILSVEKHPDADSLYVEQVDVGEEEPRTIVSGLVDYVPLEEMQGRDVIVLINLQPRNMRGVKSFGMLLCASNDAHDVVEPLAAPAGTAPGERVCFGDFDPEYPDAATQNQMKKKKFWEKLQPGLRTGNNLVAGWQGVPMSVSGGAVTAATLKSAGIS